MVADLQQTINNFIIDNIIQEMFFFFITAIISFIGYKEEWGDIEQIWAIIGVVSSVILLILLVIYLTPFTIESLKSIS